MEVPADVPTVAGATPRPGFVRRVFGSSSYLRLWLAQVTSSLGDWIGLFATIAKADQLSSGASGASTGFVLSARMIPGFFFGQFAGVMVDRWDRKRTMVICDIARGLVMATFPFLRNIWQLFAASFALEMLTMMWTPAKEATIPNIVPPDKLQTVNSFGLAAAYGTFPFAAAVSAGLFKVAEVLGRHDPWRFLAKDRETVAIYFDVLTFFVSAALIATLVIHVDRDRTRKPEEPSAAKAFKELKEGWRFISASPAVRSIMIGLTTGLFGGAMVIPLGLPFARSVLDAGEAGYSLLLTALGCGVAVGVVLLGAIQRHFSRERIFTMAVLIAGGSLIGAAGSNSLDSAVLFTAALGVCAGAAYVTGYTVLHERVDDALRGRTFAALYTLVRLAVVMSMAVAPVLSGLAHKLSGSLIGDDRTIGIWGFDLRLPGPRITLWIGGLVMIFAGLLAVRSLRETSTAPAASSPVAPPEPADSQAGEAMRAAPDQRAPNSDS